MKTNIKNTWFKPYILNPHNINKLVDSTKPGVYMLGNVEPGKKVKVQKIRTTRNVREELLESLGKFQVFMYKPLKHQLEAFKNIQQKLQFV